MFRKLHLRRLTRGLRFRLTAGYALFFAFLSIGIAFIFRQTLVRSLDTQAHDTLTEEWRAVKGYLRIDRDPDLGKNASNWYFSDDDPDEATIVLDLKKIYMVADRNGNMIQDAKTKELEYSTAYDEIGLDPPALIRERMNKALAAVKPGTPGLTFWDVRWNSHGDRFLFRAGLVFDEGHMQAGQHLPYYVSIGYPLAEYDNILRRLTWKFIAIIPGTVILGSILGWIMTGRSLKPVLAVARAAQRISSSNLSLRIPTRQAGDELDYLVLTFNRMIERLEASFQQMKQFSADVSHELRTPITAIRGQLEVALFTAKTTDQYREAMFNALQDVDRLSQIVRALLLLSQAETGQVVLQKSRINLSELVTDLVEQFQILAEEAKITLTADLPPECHAEVDRVQIERLITNLLSNALKFTDKGGKVNIALHALPGSTELIIEDNGRGIAPEYLPHIFDRFYRVPGSGTAPGPEQGLGLGLSFVAWIAKAHHGKIDVDSTPGKGTRFTIKLPACDSGSDAMELVAPTVTHA